MCHQPIYEQRENGVAAGDTVHLGSKTIKTEPTLDFSDFTMAELRTKRKSAMIALEKLTMGKGIVELVDQSGERVRYAPSDTGKIRAWVSHLNAEIERRDGGGDRGGAIWFYP